MSKEAKARIKINELLKEAGWKFLDDADEEGKVEEFSDLKTMWLNKGLKYVYWNS